MKAVLTRVTPEIDKEDRVIDINSIADLLDIIREEKQDVIISRQVDDEFPLADFTIMVVNDYLD
jgi:hypothetical protein